MKQLLPLGGLDALYSILSAELQREARRHSVTLEPGNAISQFKYLIEMACTNAGERVAVIIDEYDKPLLETMTGDADTHKAISRLY
jgi:hypothetical protein